MTLASQIVQDLEESILRGEYRPNDKIPSISESGKKYGVSHVTVLRAYRELEAKNLIVSKKGLGNFVKPFHAVRTKTGRIGVFTRPQRPVDKMDNYFNCINIGIEMAASEYRLDILRSHSSAVFNQNSPAPDALASAAEDIIKMEPSVDGFIIDERFPDDQLAELLPRLSKPLVMVNRLSRQPILSVANDNQFALENLLACALHAGCTRTLFIANMSRTTLDPESLDRYSCLLKVSDRIPGLEIIDNCWHKDSEDFSAEITEIVEKLLKTGEKIFVLAETEYNLRAFQTCFPNGSPQLLLAGMTGLNLHDDSSYAGRFCNSIPDTYAIGKKAVALLGDPPARPGKFLIKPKLYLGSICKFNIINGENI